jgi:hypothetical protein
MQRREFVTILGGAGGGVAITTGIRAHPTTETKGLIDGNRCRHEFPVQRVTVG